MGKSGVKLALVATRLSAFPLDLLQECYTEIVIALVGAI